MAKSEMDKFNEEEEPSKPKNKDVVWDDTSETGIEAACAVCDALFTSFVDRPPIFCPQCKQGLAEILQL